MQLWLLAHAFAFEGLSSRGWAKWEVLQVVLGLRAECSIMSDEASPVSPLAFGPKLA